MNKENSLVIRESIADKVCGWLNEKNNLFSALIEGNMSNLDALKCFNCISAFSSLFILPIFGIFGVIISLIWLSLSVKSVLTVKVLLEDEQN